jgi:photosystem II stability/assembly factor-like uncharacterized protein
MAAVIAAPLPRIAAIPSINAAQAPSTGVISGPGVDVITAIAVDPTNENVVYAGTRDAGIWKTSDGGATWVASNNGYDIGLRVYSLAIAPSDPNIIYAISYWGSLFKSADGGASWTPIRTPKDYGVNAIAIDPLNSDTVYSGGYLGASKTTDGGVNWSPINSGLTHKFVTLLAIDPVNTSILYAWDPAVPDLFKSTNAGESWNAIAFPGTIVTAIAIDPSNHNTIHVAASGYGASAEDIVTSTDGGATWGTRDGGLNYLTSIITLIVDGSGTIYVGDAVAGLFKGANGGTTWSAQNSGLTSLQVQALAVSLSSPSTLYVGTTTAAFKSVDASATWNSIGAGLPGATVNALAADPFTPGVLYAGTGPKLMYAAPDVIIVNSVPGLIYVGTEGGANWKLANLSAAPYPITTVYTISPDPAHPGTLYAGADSSALKSTDGGASWLPINGNSEQPINFIYASSFAFQPSGEVFIGTWQGIYESTDGGGEWLQRNRGIQYINTPAILFVYDMSALSADPSNQNTMYAGTETGHDVYKTMNGGKSWMEARAGLPHQQGVNALAINPSDPKVLYAGMTKGLFQSTSGGNSWVRRDIGSPAPPVFALAINPRRPSTVYAATTNGVIRSLDNGATWQPVSIPLNSIAATALVFDPFDPATLYVGSAAGISRFVAPTPVIASAGFDGDRLLTITGTGLEDVAQVNINGIDRTSMIESKSDTTIVLKGHEAALGLAPGANTIELIGSSGAASNVFVLTI